MDKIPINTTLEKAAFFFDVDGTLVDIAPRPEAVICPPELPSLLRALAHKTQGAVALITGREIAFIDHILPKLGLPVAGLHGAEIQTADGMLTTKNTDQNFLFAKEFIRLEALRFPGVIFEDKNASVALHYRHAPDYEQNVKESISKAAKIAGSDWQIQYGKMVAELRPSGYDKGSAIEYFMQTAPFKNRLPYAFGDDLTDEDMFVACARYAGAGIFIGESSSNTSASFTIASPDRLRSFLTHLLAQPGGSNIFRDL